MWRGHYLFVGSGTITELSLSINRSFPVLLVNSLLYRAPPEKEYRQQQVFVVPFGDLVLVGPNWFLLGPAGHGIQFSEDLVWPAQCLNFSQERLSCSFCWFQLLLLGFHCTLLFLLLQYSPCSAENYGHVFLSVIASRFLLSVLSLYLS